LEPDRWLGVELRHLEALTAVAREGSFRRAADSLGYVQSAVSQQVAYLEGVVGVRLVERRSGCKDVHLTKGGHLLLAHVDEIFTRLRSAQAHLGRGRDDETERAPLRVGVFQSVAIRLFPEILRRVRCAARNARVVPIESSCAAAMSTLVEKGEVDVAFGDLPLEPGPFASRPLLRDSCALLVPAGSEWANHGEPLTVEALARLPLLGLQDSRFMSGLEQWFRVQGLNPSFVLRSANLAILKAWVRAGLGAAIVPTVSLEARDTTTDVVELTDVVPARQVVLYWHRERQLEGDLETFCEVAAAVALETMGVGPAHTRLAPAREGAAEV
jgi:DNA-binding transcriptional LysR family regulator